jgi:HEPN domain-containing protein
MAGIPWFRLVSRMGERPVKSTQGTEYRLNVAQGFLDEARQDVSLGRWRSVMDNSQLAVENAAKAVLTLIGPVGRTHKPGPLLRQALQDGKLAAATPGKIKRLAELSELLGFDIHIQADYGDEMGGRTPWELFDEPDARQALVMAEEALNLAQTIVKQAAP